MDNVEVFVLEGGTHCPECLPICPCSPRIQQSGLPKHQGAEATDHLWVSDTAGSWSLTWRHSSAGPVVRAHGHSLAPLHPRLPLTFPFIPCRGFHKNSSFTLLVGGVAVLLRKLFIRMKKFSLMAAGPQVAPGRSSVPSTSGHICLGLVIWRCHSWRHSKTGPCGTSLVLPDTFCFVLMVKELVRAEQSCRKSC